MTRANRRLLVPVFLLATGPGAFSQQAAPPTDAQFSGRRALEHVQRMVALGPRVAGTREGAACGDYILQQLAALNIKTREQPFTTATPLGERRMRNIIAEIPGRRDQVIILGGHYDTKLFPNFTFVGANDGGSSAAVLLEFARVLAARRGEFTVWIVFFDGEEAFIEWTDDDSLYGSRHMVRSLDRDGKLTSVRAMVLVDMVGSRLLLLKRETYSTPWLVDLIWKKAAEMGHRRIFVSDEFAAFDDHYPFLQVGIPAVDLLDLTYPFWHRREDTPDKLSPGSMEIVGRVVLASLPLIEERLASGR